MWGVSLSTTRVSLFPKFTYIYREMIHFSVLLAIVLCFGPILYSVLSIYSPEEMQLERNSVHANVQPITVDDSDSSVSNNKTAVMY